MKPKPRFSAWALPLACGALVALCGTAAQAQAANPATTYSLGAFKRLVIEGPAEIKLSQGEVDQMVIEGDAEMQKRVETELRGDRLTIQPSGSWKFWNSRKTPILITVRDLAEINILGSGDVSSDGPLKVEQLMLKISGSGTIRLGDVRAKRLAVQILGSGDAQAAGAVQNLSVSISGTGDFTGHNLQAGFVKVSIAGVGNVSVWAVEDLVASLSGAGSVNYWGNPHNVKKSVSGVGSVNAKGDKPPR